MRLSAAALVLLGLGVPLAEPRKREPEPEPEPEPREGEDGIWRQRVRRYDAERDHWYVAEIDEPDMERLKHTIAVLLREDGAAEERVHAARQERLRQEAEERWKAELIWEAGAAERERLAEERLKAERPAEWRQLQADRWNREQRGRRRGNIGGKNPNARSAKKRPAPPEEDE